MFNTTLSKLDKDYLYFIMPLKESSKYKKGTFIRFTFYEYESRTIIGSFAKLLGKGRLYGDEKKRLYYVIVPKAFIKSNKLKKGSEVTITCQRVK